MTRRDAAARTRPQRPSAAPADEPRSPLTPDAWIAAATDQLVAHGIDSVRVDVLARTLGVTRGSFYWHFEDREDLLKAVLKAWRDAATELLIARFERRQSDPRKLLKELISLPFRGRAARRAAGIEIAIRAWARRDPMARQALDDVDSRRIAFCTQCFSALGFSMREARARAFLLYGYEVSESILWNQGNDAQKGDRSALMTQLLLLPVLDLSRSPGAAAPVP
ncbi:TetR/AcrR family transcriptional regulator [Aquabacterium sp. J223]|uniref:TetR/AcrR family transcriptional regulator n=1 Tax=Aquabacterium sp. J223 TaxID=2898431 RepID=UPI0021AE2FDA|nr:TetR/AcrR family transcriptional regulator [Aquabacterium sp. J223]UUX94385.1 TetR/AcrR family transcriptional regulator [Aquabacterium sp. J223]